MRYMPAPDEATCQTVSAAIYRLTRPLGAHTSETTQFAFGWRQATDQTWWMEWPDDMPLPIHAERGTETLQTLAAFVAAGQLSQASADAAAALVQANVGSTVTLGQITPPEWAAVMLTGEDAEQIWPDDETP